jgi:hypothetical protein
MVVNVPCFTINGLRIYKLEKYKEDLYKIETKLVCKVDPDDSLSNDVRDAVLFVPLPLLKKSFNGMKTSDLVGKYIDIIADLFPKTRNVESKNDGSWYKSTTWFLEIIDIGYAGAVLEGARSPSTEEVTL